VRHHQDEVISESDHDPNGSAESLDRHKIYGLWTVSEKPGHGSTKIIRLSMLVSQLIYSSEATSVYLKMSVRRAGHPN
jgi:hypothetical protein